MDGRCFVMYNVRYVSGNGDNIRFGADTDCIIATMDGVTGYEVEAAVSQGFGQTGVSVGNLAVGGQSVGILGFIRRNDTAAKRALLSAFAPLSSGVLWWEEKYWLPVIVKNAPQIAQTSWARFSVTLLAPYPFWRGKDANRQQIGRVIPEFRLPVNYAQTHRFGTTDVNNAVNCFVRGNLETDFRLTFTAKNDSVVNPSLVNLSTRKSSSFTVTLLPGDSISMYREDGVLRVVKSVSGLETSAFDTLDDTSALFSLAPGDNPLRVDADSGKLELSTEITYYDVYAGVYNGM